MGSLPSDLLPQVQRRLYAWLCLAVASLVGAGVFAALVALSRTPGISEFFHGRDYLRAALVGHVILAVVIWFLAFQGVLWILAGRKGSWLGFWLAAFGTLTLIIPAILGRGQPILANYVPVLDHPGFLFGLMLFAAGIGLSALYTLGTIFGTGRPLALLSFGAAITSGLVLLALLCFGLAALQLPEGLPPAIYFEKLSWGGGHVLQFANTAAMVLVWLLLARLVLGVQVLNDRPAKGLLGLYLFFALPAPFLYLGTSPEFGFTLLMVIGLGPVTGIMAFFLLRAWVKHRQKRPPWEDPGFASLIFSLWIFGLGGFISLGIRGSNVIIPAHYHGVIGAVTLSFMGLSYHLLPYLNREIWSLRLARVQPYLYGIGQSLFVLGMLWAGLYGVPRKTFGAAQELDRMAQAVGMGLMGVGGLVAILGGIAFIVNMAASLLSGEKAVSHQVNNYSVSQSA